MKLAPTKKLITVLFFLFIGETAVMGFINMLKLPAAIEAFVDSSALILIAIPVLYVQLVKPLISQYRATEEARQTTQLLLDAGTELSQSLELGEVNQVLFQHVHKVLPFECAAVYLRGSSFELISRAEWRCSIKKGEILLPEKVDPNENPFFQKVLTGRRTVIVSGLRPHEGRGSAVTPGICGTWMGIPLIAAGEVFGLCIFGHPDPHSSTPEQIQLAEGLSGGAAAAIQNAKLFEEIRSSNERIKSLTHKTVEIQERERRLLARDLYDDVGQEIVTVLLQLRLVEEKLNQDEEMRSIILCIDEELSAIMDKLHNMAFNLRPASLDHLGLVEAVRQDLDKLSEESNIKVQFETFDMNERLPERVETILYRIVQEALTNVAKHSQATRVDLIMKKEENRLTLILEDNGIGFDDTFIHPQEHLGLSGMRERVEMIAGKLSIETSPGIGTAIFVTVPDLAQIPAE